MVAHALPLETIEHTLDFLREDLRALAKCSLVCRALLPTCRTHLYRDIHLSHQIVNGKTVETPQTNRFFQMVDAEPDILLYVRKLTLDYGQYMSDSSLTVPSTRNASLAWQRVLRRTFPSLRDLTLCGLTMAGLRDHIMLITEILPELESLSFHDVQLLDDPTDYGVPLSVIAPELPEDWAPHGAAAQSKLRAFSLVEVSSKDTELPSLVPLLESYPHIDSVDIRPQLPYTDNSPGDPRLIIASFAPRLRHLGVLVYDITDDGEVPEENRERMESVLSDLPHCGSLRSLCVHYSCLGFCVFTMMSGTQLSTLTPPPLRPLFLNKLCDVLSSNPPPFPHLEELAIVLHNPLNWLKDWMDSLDRLSWVLIGERGAGGAPIVEGAARYPRFRRLEICASILELARLMYGDKGAEEAHMQWNASRRQGSR
ncbi:hypothetical protein FKP32DRAFT_1603342 [Trametes sanguinea]|nr:hypothetical protein FKP32DRAFT_1603342 [Trametes sanguinea]